MPLVSARFVEMFCAIVETGNYTLAATQLGVTPAAVSRAVARNEAALGVPLFRRTTRSVKLTDAGQRYFEQCRAALSLLEDAERAISGQQAEPRGLVRVSVPGTYGHYRVLPMVERFRARYPRVTLELDVSSRNIDLVAERFDMAVRMGPLEDSTLVVRKLEDAPFAVFASPGYLKRHGAPEHPGELARHTCITFVRPSTGRPLPWLFLEDGKRPFEVAPGSELRCSGDVLGCVTLARQGAGLVQTYRFIVEDDVRRGRLVEVLAPYAGRSAPFSLLEPAHAKSLAARLFADMLVERCAARPAVTSASRAHRS